MSLCDCEKCSEILHENDYPLHVTRHLRIDITSDSVIIHSKAYSLDESVIHVREDEIDKLIEELKLVKIHLENRPCCV